MSDELVATVVMRPASGRSLEDAPPITAESLDAFRPAPEDVEAVTGALAAAGGSKVTACTRPASASGSGSSRAPWALQPPAAAVSMPVPK